MKTVSVLCFMILGTLFPAFAQSLPGSWGTDGPFTIQNVQYDVSQPGSSYLKVQVNTTTRIYVYDARKSGNSYDDAKVFAALLLSAHSSGRRVIFNARQITSSEWEFNRVDFLD